MDVFVIRENELGNADTGYKHSETGGVHVVERDYVEPGIEEFNEFDELLDKTRKITRTQDQGNFRYVFKAYKGAKGDRMFEYTVYQKKPGGSYKKKLTRRFPEKK